MPIKLAGIVLAVLLSMKSAGAHVRTRNLRLRMMSPSDLRQMLPTQAGASHLKQRTV